MYIRRTVVSNMLTKGMHGQGGGNGPPLSCWGWVAIDTEWGVGRGPVVNKTYATSHQPQFLLVGRGK